MGAAKLRDDAGERLIPHAIDDLAREQPGRVLYEVALGPNPDSGYHRTTAWEFANAINRAAWWIEKSLGRGESFPTMGYVGPGDLRYLILVVAAVKVGYKMLFISPRNSIEGDLAVIRGAECNIWLLPADGGNFERLLPSLILANHPMKTLELPGLAFFFDREEVPQYEYDKTWEEARHHPCWVLHTSGSTGHPKPVVRKLGSAASTEANRLCGPIDGRPLLVKDFIGARIYVGFPLFHSAGLTNGLLWPFFYDSTVIFGPEGPMSLDIVDHILATANIDVVFTASSILEDIASDKEILARTMSLKAVSWGGGPLSRFAGDLISARTRLVTFFGTSESGWLICVENDSEDWNYLRFHPNAGLELRHYSEGLYELFAVRDPKLEKWQNVFSTFPDLQEYSFKDLFSRHPTKPHLWVYEGRADNIIALSNGEKFNPLAMEQKIGTHPLVRSALVAGLGKFQASAIVELTDRAIARNLTVEVVIDEIWPTIEEANKEAPRYGRLAKDHIMIASPDMPFPRASKGTVQRGGALQLYKDDLDRLYELVEVGIGGGDSSIFDIDDLSKLRDSIRENIKSLATSDLGDDDDIFAAGFDSLAAIELQRQLRRSLSKTHDRQKVLRVIYSNPTINKLTEGVHDLFSTGDTPTQVTVNARIHAMQSFYDRYSASLPIRPLSKSPRTPSNEKAQVILTGSTGSLGSYLLDTLITSDAASEIWALNRSADGESKQTVISAERGLRTDWKASGVHFLQADISGEYFGLSPENYAYLLENTTQIIHNQWQVDFNLSIASFEPHIRGVRRLIDFSLEAAKTSDLNPRREVSIFFTSSVGVAHNWSNLSEVPETAPLEFSFAKGGYGESKSVAERLLTDARTKSAVRTIIARLGQIAGPVTRGKLGLWNRKEWLPTIIETSAQLSLLPASLGRNDTIDWIPVDLLAKVIVELAITDSSKEDQAVFHGINPKKAYWPSLVPIIQQHLVHGDTDKVKVVPWAEWLDAVRKAEGHPEKGNIPALKLLDYYDDLSVKPGKEDSRRELRVPFKTTATQAHSPTLTTLEPVSVEWLEIWLQQWGY